MSNLAKLEHRNSELREGSAVQVQLTEIFLLMKLETPLLKRILRELFRQLCWRPWRVKNSMSD